MKFVPGINRYRALFSGLAKGLVRRLDVLVHAEPVFGIVLLLHGPESGVVAPVCRADTFLALLHHEVDIGSARRVGMERLPVPLSPRGNALLVGGVRIDPDDDFSPSHVAVAERGLIHSTRRTAPSMG